MNHNSRRFLTALSCGLAGLALFFAAACKLGPSKAREERSAKAPSAASQNSSNPGINLNCVVDHIQNPPEAFHYTYKKDTSDDNLIQDADISPDTITGSSKSKYGTHDLKGVKSDAASWQSAWSGLMGISGMSSTVALIHSGSPTVREGTEKMNGYDAIRYSIDTARGDAAEAGLYRATLGAGGFEKGMAWVTAQGCPVKLSLDSEMHLNNGSVDTVHYEIAMVKK
ncbi:MAG TPA: hypothetical protein VNK47_02435 [Candidatus Dormibacteraeota bacterium]|nr:hypothetical protein [Candidatus Dormibacteraeota bacterium]